VAYKKSGNEVAIGFDEGAVVVKVCVHDVAGSRMGIRGQLGRCPRGYKRRAMLESSKQVPMLQS
jgi:hypothetical protein